MKLVEWLKKLLTNPITAEVIETLAHFLIHILHL